MHRAHLPAWAMTLPPARSVVLIVVMFQQGTAAEASESMNAPGEAEIAGVFASLPWVALLCVEVLAIAMSVWAGSEHSLAGQVATMTFLAIASFAIGGGWIAWALTWGSPIPWATPMAFAVVLPLVPAWLSVVYLSLATRAQTSA